MPKQDFLYHRVPANMVGDVLYPLNMLKQLHPEVYDEQSKKYQGRENLLMVKVPPLKCLWNDVLHFTAVEPQTLKSNLAKAGIEMSDGVWFQIPISLLLGNDSVAFLYRHDTIGENSKEYEAFDPARMNVYQTVPEETLHYYAQAKAEGKKPFLFHLIPHILYKGSLDTKDLARITIR